jgi:hypothetical protein
MFNWLKMLIAGRSKFSLCCLGMHPWDSPGGHCEKCGMCDEFFGPHDSCRIARSTEHGDK